MGRDLFSTLSNTYCNCKGVLSTQASALSQWYFVPAQLNPAISQKLYWQIILALSLTCCRIWKSQSIFISLVDVTSEPFPLLKYHLRKRQKMHLVVNRGLLSKVNLSALMTAGKHNWCRGISLPVQALFCHFFYSGNSILLRVTKIHESLPLYCAIPLPKASPLAVICNMQT